MRLDVERAGSLLSRSIAATSAVAFASVGLVVLTASVLTDHVAHGQERSADVSADVRIAAQRLEDGEVRFGLRVRDGSGGWAEPVMPRAHRLDPESASRGHWLVSSPLTLEVDDSGSGGFARGDRFEPSRDDEVELVGGLEGWSGDTRYSAYHDENGDLVTNVSVYGASIGAPDGELRTSITCRDGETSVRIGGLPYDIGDGNPNQQVPVTWSVDHGSSRTERLAVSLAATGLELGTSVDSRLAEAMIGYGSTLALAIGTPPEFTTDIDLGDLRALPVYPNLRHCGGDAVQTGHAELRIRAQVRDDNWIEFAVQQRTAEGWIDHILPRARTIAAFGEATNWLSSTPVSVRIELDPAPEIVLPDTVVRQAPEPITPVFRSGFFTSSLYYEVAEEELEGYYPTRLSSVAVAEGSDGEHGLRLQVGCFGDERWVLLVGAPPDTNGDLTLFFDNTQLFARWTVDHRQGMTSLTPGDSERTIQRLRDARSLSVRLGHGVGTAVTFDLVDLFETPIQANIDQCGNYREPEWQPVTGFLLEQNDLGEYYTTYYPEWAGFQRISQVRVNAIEGATGAPTGDINLVMTCNTERLAFTIWGLPDVGQPDSIRLRIDDGEWYDESVDVYSQADGSFSAELITDLNQLKQGSALQFELGQDEPARGTFDISSLLGTPIQVNFDNCGRAYWPPGHTYVPVVAAREQRSRYVIYRAREREDGTVSTTVELKAITTFEGDGESTLEAHCFGGSALQAQINLPPGVESGQADVTLRIDDLPPDTSTWIVEGTASRGILHPPSNAYLLAQLRRASVVIVEAPDVIPTPIRFLVSGMFDTPVQGNLDECGYYQAGEVRTLPLPLNAYEIGVRNDPERDLAVIRFWQRTPGTAAMPTTRTLEQHHRGDSTLIGLSFWCGENGARLAIYGDVPRSLTGDRVEVEWNTDGGSAQREIWNVSGAESKAISPLRARTVIASWREASELEFRLVGADPTTHRFNLGEIFAVPVIDSFDACLAAPIPSQSPPVASVPAMESGELRFGAMFFDGSAWLTSYVNLPDSGAAPTQEDEEDVRSFLAISCGMDGLFVGIARLDAAQSTFIQGDAVDMSPGQSTAARSPSAGSPTRSRSDTPCRRRTTVRSMRR